jgi:hypothetical protein
MPHTSSSLRLANLLKVAACDDQGPGHDKAVQVFEG